MTPKYKQWRMAFYLLLIVSIVTIYIILNIQHGVYFRKMNIDSDYTAKEVALKIDFPYKKDLIILNDEFDSVDYFYKNKDTLWIKTNLTNGTNKYGFIYSK